MKECKGELELFRDAIGGERAHNASRKWDKADEIGNVNCKKAALKAKTAALMLQNPFDGDILSHRGRSHLDTVMNHFWWVNPKENLD